MPLAGGSEPGYFLRRFNSIEFLNRLELTWFWTTSLNIFGSIAPVERRYRNEQSFQIAENGHLQPYELVFESLPRSTYRRRNLGMQWIFTNHSQLRFQLESYRNSDLFYGNFYFKGRKDAGGTQASLSFLYSMQ